MVPIPHLKTWYLHITYNRNWHNAKPIVNPTWQHANYDVIPQSRKCFQSGWGMLKISHISCSILWLTLAVLIFVNCSNVNCGWWNGRGSRTDNTAAYTTKTMADVMSQYRTYPPKACQNITVY